MCDDCQAYAHLLGRAHDILDAHGGTDVFYPTPAQVAITRAHEHLRCVRLSARGILRWYTACCHTPVAHTVASSNVPFIGIPHTFIHGTQAERNALLGPISARIRGRYGKDPLPKGAHLGVPLRALVRSYALLLWAWLRRRHMPTPFFDPDTGAPVLEPTVVSPEQREHLRRLCESF